MLTLLNRFHEFKLALIGYSGLAKDALHIYFGLLVYLVVRVLIRGRRGAVVAWAAVVAMAVAGEWLDRANVVRFGAAVVDAEHWHDIWNTAFWPTVLMLLGWGPARRADARPDPASGSDGGDQPFE